MCEKTPLFAKTLQVGTPWLKNMRLFMTFIRYLPFPLNVAYLIHVREQSKHNRVTLIADHLPISSRLLWLDQ